MVGLAVTVMVVLLVGRDKRLVEQADKGHRSGREEQEQDHHKEDGKATLAHLVRLGCFQFILPICNRDRDCHHGGWTEPFCP